MSHLVDDILSQVDIVDVVSSYVKLKRAGKNFLGLCPFHQEKTPSFTVAPDKQIFKCFGCGQGGNILTFVQEIERIDFREAAKILCKSGNIDISKYQKNADQYESQVTEKERTKLINSKALMFFQEQLQHNTKALSYLQDQRKLSQGDIIQWSIGYAPEQHDALLSYLYQQGFEASDICASGLAKMGSNGSVYSMFRHRIMFAIHDHIGNIVGFAGRALDADDMPKYLNIPETILYNKSQVLYGLHRAKQNINTFKHLVIVEGYMDVIGLSKFGLPIGIATCGTSLTSHHIRLLKRYQATIICAFDNDHAGFQAMLRSLSMFYEYDIYPKVLTLPQDIKDIDEWQKYESDHNIGTIDLQHFLSHTQEGFEAGFKRLLSMHDSHDPIQRKLIIAQVFDLLKHVADYSVLMLYIAQISHILQIDQTLLFNQYKTHIKGQTLKTLPKNNIQMMPYSSDTLMASLVRDDMLSKFTQDASVQGIYRLIVEVYELLQDQTLQELTHNHQTEILTAQMRWEKQLYDQDESKRIQYISNFLFGYLQKLTQKMMKSHASPSSKQRIMIKFQDLVKKRTT